MNFVRIMYDFSDTVHIEYRTRGLTLFVYAIQRSICILPFILKILVVSHIQYDNM